MLLVLKKLPTSSIRVGPRLDAAQCSEIDFFVEKFKTCYKRFFFGQIKNTYKIKYLNLKVSHKLQKTAYSMKN